MVHRKITKTAAVHPAAGKVINIQNKTHEIKKKYSSNAKEATSSEYLIERCKWVGRGNEKALVGTGVVEVVTDSS